MTRQHIIQAKVAVLVGLIVLRGCCTPDENDSSIQPGWTCNFGQNSTGQGVLVGNYCVAPFLSKKGEPPGNVASFEDVVRYCDETYSSKDLLSGFTGHDLNLLPLGRLAFTSIRLLLGVQLLLKRHDDLKIEKIDTTMHTEYKVPMAHSNGTVAGSMKLHFHREMEKGWITFPHFPFRFEMKNSSEMLSLMNTDQERLCIVVEVKRESSFSRLVASASTCGNGGAWNVAFCQYSPRKFCPKVVSRECVWTENSGSCVWRYRYSRELYEGPANETKCPTVMEGEPDEECTCTQCKHTQWTTWSMFQDPLGNVAIIRYRPMDVVKRWNCTMYSAICCTQLAALSTVSDGHKSTEETLAMIQCLNGGFKATPTSRCKCPRGATGLFCEIDHDDCANNACLNGAACRDHLNGYECVCTRDFYGEYCELKRGETLKGSEIQGNWTLVYLCILLPIILLVFLSMLFFISACSDEDDAEKNQRPVQISVSRIPRERRSAEMGADAERLATCREINEQGATPLHYRQYRLPLETSSQGSIHSPVLGQGREGSPKMDDFITSSERRRIRKLMRQRAIRKRELARLLRGLDSKRDGSPAAKESQPVSPRRSSIEVPIKKPTWLLEPSLRKNKEMSPTPSEKTATKSGQATSKADAFSLPASPPAKSENDLVGLNRKQIREREASKGSEPRSPTRSSNKILSANQPLKSKELSADLSLPEVIGNKSGESPSRTDSSYKQVGYAPIGVPLADSMRRKHPLELAANTGEESGGRGSTDKIQDCQRLGREEEMAVSLHAPAGQPAEAEVEHQVRASRPTSVSDKRSTSKNSSGSDNSRPSSNSDAAKRSDSDGTTMQK